MYLVLMHCENLVESGTENMGGFLQKISLKRNLKEVILHFTDIDQDMILSSWAFSSY